MTELERKALASAYAFILERMAVRQSETDVRESLGGQPSRRNGAQPKEVEQTDDKEETQEKQEKRTNEDQHTDGE